MKRSNLLKVKVLPLFSTRPIGQRCVLSVLRFAFCDGDSGGFGGGVGGGGGVGSGRGSGNLSPRMILSS